MKNFNSARVWVRNDSKKKTVSAEESVQSPSNIIVQILLFTSDEVSK